MTLIARWETKGKDFLELTRSTVHAGFYLYDGNGCGGSFDATSDDDAIEKMEAPWGPRTGAVTVLKSDRPSLKRVK